MIIPATIDRHLVYLNAEGKQVAFKVVAFDISDKGELTPLCYPKPPKGAATFACEEAGFRVFDLATGVSSGSAMIQPKV